jgi:hypothetical protein
MSTISEINTAKTRNPSLSQAVIDRLGGGDEITIALADVARNGASAGWCGFIYYSDTLAFFDANRGNIMQLAKDMAEEFGTDALTMIAGFNCLRSDKLTATDVCEAIHGETENTQAVKNALAWFALEEVARELSPDA